ncbi:hypothetical protein ACPV5G_20180 [Photobacterium damselae]|uniref:hypothetical protein n=1 Tax=Photobacterium damselae TaxID=38293 RepID=UPI00406814D2
MLRRLIFLYLFLFLSTTATATAKTKTIGVVIGSSSYASSPSNREKLCIVRGFQKKFDLSLQIKGNGHSALGTYKAIQEIDSHVVALPLLTNELPTQDELMNSDKVYIMSSSASFRPTKRFYSVIPDIDKQAKFISNNVTEKFIMIGDNSDYSQLAKKALENYRSFDFFNITSIEDIEHRLNNRKIILAVPLKKISFVFNRLKKINKNIEVISFDIGALRDREITLYKGNERIKYSWIKNWNGKTTRDFRDVYNIYCNEIQRKPTFLNVLTYDVLMASYAYINGLKSFESARLQKKVPLGNVSDSFFIETIK